jgi:hypothetical protein
MRWARARWNALATDRRRSSSNQKLTQACRYSVGRYSLWGVNHATSTSTSLAENSGVPPPPQNPTTAKAAKEAAKGTEVITVSRKSYGLLRQCLIACAVCDEQAWIFLIVG